jgi:hypothetical protein
MLGSGKRVGAHLIRHEVEAVAGRVERQVPAPVRPDTRDLAIGRDAEEVLGPELAFGREEEPAVGEAQDPR